MSADPPPRASGGGSAPANTGATWRGSLRAQWVVWLFAAVGLVGILCIIALVTMIFAFDRPRQTAKVAAGKQETVFTVGTPEDLPGTSLMHLSVSTGGGRGSGSGPYSGTRDDQRNVLLIDKATGASRRILPDNERRILSVRFLPAKAEIADAGSVDTLDAAVGGEEKQPKAPAAYYLLVLEQVRSERQDVLIGTLAGGRQGIVMQGLDGVDTTWMKSATEIGLVVRERLGLYYRVIDIPTLKVVQSERIAME